jgi:hypothetical protein
MIVLKISSPVACSFPASRLFRSASAICRRASCGGGSGGDRWALDNLQGLLENGNTCRVRGGARDLGRAD